MVVLVRALPVTVVTTEDSTPVLGVTVLEDSLAASATLSRTPSWGGKPSLLSPSLPLLLRLEGECSFSVVVCVAPRPLNPFIVSNSSRFSPSASFLHSSHFSLSSYHHSRSVSTCLRRASRARSFSSSHSCLNALSLSSYRAAAVSSASLNLWE